MKLYGSQMLANFFVGLIGLCLVVLNHSSLQAVTFEEQSNRLQLIYAHLLDLHPNGPPQVVNKSRWQGTVDFIVVPTVDNRVGRKEEKVSAPPLIPRPRGHYLHTSGLKAGGAWLPPLEVMGNTTNLPALEVGYFLGKEAWAFGVRGTYSVGDVNGTITDSDHKDDFKFDRSGMDFSLGYQYDDWTPYLGRGAGHLNATLDIKVDGVTTKIKNHSYTYYLGGVAYQYNEWFSFNFEQYQAEHFLRYMAFSINYTFN